MPKALGEGGNRELFFNEYRFSALQVEKHSGNEWLRWLHNDMNVLISIKCTLKMVKMIHFYIYFITINKTEGSDRCV